MHNLKNYDSNLVMQEPGKFKFKINVTPEGLEKCINFSINYTLTFIDSFQCLISSLDDLVKKLGKDDSKYLSQKFHSKIFNVFKQKAF